MQDLEKAVRFACLRSSIGRPMGLDWAALGIDQRP